MLGLKKLLDNSRFYILASSVLLSVAVVSLLRIQIPSDQLLYIRTEQVFGLIAILYWYVAIMVSPLGYVIGKERLKHLAFARRAIGVSAAYFALLHGSVALWGQLGGLGQLAYLPPLFKWSLAGGAVAALILLIMAATSFDKVVAYMTFPRWKLLHRLVYIGGVLAVLHIWTIGTHLAYTGVQLAAFIALVILAGLEMFRVTTRITARIKELQGKDYFYALFFGLWAGWIALFLSLPVLVENYHHQRHVDTSIVRSVYG